MRPLPAKPELATLVRMSLGGLLIAHGAAKFSRGEDHVLARTSAEFDELGFRAPAIAAGAAGVSQISGGLALAAGFAQPVACSVLNTNLAVASGLLYAKNGFWNKDGGCEYPLVLLLAIASLCYEGPGPFSLDSLRGRNPRGPRVALLSLLASAVGAAAGFGMLHRAPRR